MHKQETKTMEISYPARLTPQVEGGFLVEFIDLADTFTEGQTQEEALFNASEVLSGMLAWHLDENHDIPAPSLGLQDAYYVAPDAKTQAVLLLRYARAGRSLADLARALETSWPQAKRLEDPRHWPSLKTLDRAARVLGKRLVLSME
jgi:antitoxin HicB